MIYQMISSFDNKEFVKAIQKSDPTDPQEKINTFYKALGKGMYVVHLVEMNYILPLQELKTKIEDYWNGEFVDDWGRKLDEMYSHEEGHDTCEKDFHQYLKWKFWNEETNAICDKADVSPLILSFWKTNSDIRGAMFGALVDHFNPSILKTSKQGEAVEMSDEEKQNYSLDQKIEQMEKSFNLIQYRDFCELALSIAESKSDPEKLYKLI